MDFGLINRFMAITQTIYQVDNWTSGRAYVKDEPALFVGGYVMYALIDHTAGILMDPLKWYGIYTDGENFYPEFTWKPNNPIRFNFEPKTKTIQFGDGYSQRSPGQINNNLLNIDINIEGRGQNEMTAIAHFLDARKGTEFFYFTPNAPFASRKKFICKTWNISNDFYNNYSLTAKFEEVPA